jgi:hypothetical protein
MQFYVNYTDNGGKTPVHKQTGPFGSVPIATNRRAELERHSPPIFSHCWVSITRDETRELVPILSARRA